MLGSLNYCMICIFSYSLDSVTVIKYCWKYAGINYWAISISGKHARVHELMPISCASNDLVTIICAFRAVSFVWVLNI